MGAENPDRSFSRNNCRLSGCFIACKWPSCECYISQKVGFLKLVLPEFRFSVEDLPQSLNQFAKEEYERFLEKESRATRDAVVIEHINNDIG